jgi:LmbE family N-acetylglucosaminyl deacetylase
MNSRAELDSKTRLRWRELSRRIVARDASLRFMVLAAHPDDEVIGASSLLSRFPNSIVVFLTDGATRDPHFWTGGPYASREDYARTRRIEAEQALAVAGMSCEQILWLGGVDQEAILEVRSLAERFEAILAEHSLDAIITHPYEGGHPDHDAAALIARVAVSATCDHAPDLFEMTSYHARSGMCVTGEFLDNPTSRADRSFVLDHSLLELLLEEEEQQRKRQMFAAYSSQRLVLENFPTEREQFRPAPEYDFTKPPHNNDKLWYECMQWPMTGARWRELAADAMERVEGPSC